MRLFRNVLIATFALGPQLAAAAPPVCAWDAAAKLAPVRVIDVDKVWTGARVNFDGARQDDRFVIGYYDQERWLTVATIDKAGTVSRQRLPSRFAGWDSHNAVALAFDRNGLLHVAGNMHADELVYFRSAAAMEPPIRVTMTGRDERHVTYPFFLKDQKGDLLFIYRSGASGDGAWLVNRWDGTRWTRVGTQSFLGDRGFGGRVSGYPSRFVLSPDGYFHLAIVWRLTPDAATNVRLSYARTKDFMTWSDSRGRALQSPLTPETAETVLHTGPNVGLLNNAKVSIDPRGRPMIVFTRQNAEGRNTVEVAVGGEGGWHLAPVAVSEMSTAVKGTGSLPQTVALSEVDFATPERPALYYRFPHAAGVRLALDPATLAPFCIEKPASNNTGRLTDRPIPTAVPQALDIDPHAELIWAAQPANNDRPRECTPDAPLACRPPPSTLRLLLR